MNRLQRLGLFSILMIFSFSTFAQKKIQTFTVERIIAAPAQDIWAVVGDDFGAIANSHPRIISSEYVNGALKGGEGAERKCYLNEKGTKYVQEKVIGYDPSNFTFKAQIIQAGKLPLDPQSSYGIYRVEPIDANTSKLVFTMGYRTKPAFMGALAKGRFKKNIKDYLIAVEHHVKTGEVVNKTNFKKIKKQYKS